MGYSASARGALHTPPVIMQGAPECNHLVSSIATLEGTLHARIKDYRNLNASTASRQADVFYCNEVFLVVKVVLFSRYGGGEREKYGSVLR